MFFAKNRPQDNISKAKITVIGTSAQAFFIADALQNEKCDVTILIPENQKQKYDKNTVLTLRPSGFQNRRAEFRFSTQAPKDSSFIFAASKPEDIKNDILLLNSVSRNNTPIINLSFFYNAEELALFNQIKCFPAFLDGQFLFEKNILTFAGRPQKIEICAPADTINTLKNLFGNNLSVNKAANPKQLFWQNFIPIYLGSLIMSAQGQNISACLNHPPIRLLADSAIKELAVLAKKQKVDFDTTSILTNLYNLADTYSGELTNRQSLSVFGNILPQINKFDTPALFELWHKTLKKY